MAPRGVKHHFALTKMRETGKSFGSGAHILGDAGETLGPICHVTERTEKQKQGRKMRRTQVMTRSATAATFAKIRGSASFEGNFRVSFEGREGAGNWPRRESDCLPATFVLAGANDIWHLSYIYGLRKGCTPVRNVNYRREPTHLPPRGATCSLVPSPARPPACKNQYKLQIKLRGRG